MSENDKNMLLYVLNNGRKMTFNEISEIISCEGCAKVTIQDVESVIKGLLNEKLIEGNSIDGFKITEKGLGINLPYNVKTTMPIYTKKTSKSLEELLGLNK